MKKNPNPQTGESRRKEGHMASTSTFSIFCPSCDDEIVATDKGFSATTVEASCPSEGAVFTLRKSAAYAAAVPEFDLRHTDGLIAIG